MDSIKNINWDSPNNLIVGGVVVIPTIVQSNKGEILGLAYSSKESLQKAISTRKGIYYSRSRREIWEKGLHMRNRQNLLEVKWDCDADSLIFIVEQHGDFCHVDGCKSCFFNGVVVTNQSPIKLSYATGHCERLSFEFLKKMGMVVWTKSSRSKEFVVKTDIGNFDLLSWKPKDIGSSLFHSDMILYYKELLPTNLQEYIDENFIILKFKSPFNPMKVCVVAKEGTIFSEKSTIATEYPFLDLKVKGKKFTTHGNSEEYVKRGFYDAAVVIVDTGKTLLDTGLTIVSEVVTSDMSLMINKNFYRNNPRICREIRNMIDESTIYFYSVDGPNGAFSNFYPCKFIDSQGREWRSSEHYYQAHKFLDQEIFELVKNTKTCKECYKVSWSYKDKFRSDWSEVKDEIMHEALLYKFKQNSSLLKILLETGDKKLVEHSMNDLHYGMGLEDNGKNRLGILLEQVRNELKGLRPRL